jgi:hypothetical protein
MIISKPQQFFVFNSTQSSFLLNSLPTNIKSKIQAVQAIDSTGLGILSWTPTGFPRLTSLTPSKIYLIFSKETGYDLPGAVDPVNYTR